MSRSRHNKLTPAQRKEIRRGPESNAGVGWHTDWETKIDPRQFEEGREPPPTLPLDNPETI